MSGNTGAAQSGEIREIVQVGHALQRVGAIYGQVNQGMLPIEQLGRLAQPWFSRAMQYAGGMHPGAAAAVREIMVAGDQALKLRASLKAEYARRPTQVLKVSWRALADATESYEALVQHPYKGSASGLLWQIHAFRAPGSAKCVGLFFSEFNLAGHDFASASKSATLINSGTQGTPTSGFGGIPMMAFAADSPRRADTDFAPWTTGESIVLTDTATLTLKLFNDSGSSFSGDFSIFVKASPCGNLWEAHRHAFHGGFAAYQVLSRGMAPALAAAAGIPLPHVNAPTFT